jgi:hypothetical protein
MSLAPGKSDLKKHLSRHIHIGKELHPIGPASLPNVIDSSKDQIPTTVAPIPALKPLA